jgi:hypothetical protein
MCPVCLTAAAAAVAGTGAATKLTTRLLRRRPTDGREDTPEPMITPEEKPS